MRVLLIAHGFPPKAMGGAELYAASHAEALARLGDDVLVLAREADAGAPEFRVRREQRGSIAIAWINNTFAAVRSFADTYTDNRIDAIAGGIIDEFRPDAAHVHHLTCLSTTIASDLAIRGIPVFCTLHDYWLLCHRGQLLDRNLQPCAGDGADPCANCLGPEASVGGAAFAGRAAFAAAQRAIPPRLRAPLRDAALRLMRTTAGAQGGIDPAQTRRAHMREVMAGVTHFFAPSEDLRARFVASGVDASRISLSPYGWALPSVASAGPTQRDGGRERAQLHLGFIGSLMASKAPHLLMEAAAELPSGSCVVHVFGEHTAYHGDESYRARLMPLLSQPHVRHHGRLDRDRLADAFAAIDVLVVPSIWPENSPLVIREAFLAAVPVVAARIGGIPETVTDGVDGLLFTAGNAGELRNALRRLLDDRHLLARLRAGIPAVRTIDDDVRGMRARYGQALSVPRSRRALAAVVLNFRSPPDTLLAVRSLLISQRPVDRIIVVDNDRDGTCREVLTPWLDRITYLPMPGNLGFSGGMNAGIRDALAGGADAVLLVNSDVVMPAAAIERLERALFATPGAGIAGPLVLGRRTPDRIASSGITYSESTGRMRHRGVGAAVVGTDSTGIGGGISAISGCVMLIRREVFAAIGELEPACFFSFEDVEFCLRARDAGFASIVVPAATALHEGGRSIGAGGARRFYFGARNQLWLANKRGSGGMGAAARSAYVIALNVAHAFRARGGSLPQRLAAVARGTRDYMIGRLGPGV